MRLRVNFLVMLMLVLLAAGAVVVLSRVGKATIPEPNTKRIEVGIQPSTTITEVETLIVHPAALHLHEAVHDAR